MIEPTTGDYADLIRLVRNRTPVAYVAVEPQDTPANLDVELEIENHFLSQGAGGGFLRNHIAVYNLAISSSEVILSIQQLMHRLNVLAADVSRFMNSGGVLRPLTASLVTFLLLAKRRNTYGST